MKRLILGLKENICIILSCAVMLNTQGPLFGQWARAIDLSKKSGGIDLYAPADSTRVVNTNALAKKVEEQKRKEDERRAAEEKELSNKLKVQYQYEEYDKTGYLSSGKWKGKRKDGSERSTGFFGEIVLQGGSHRGKVITEATVIIKKKGIEYEVPLLNPFVVAQGRWWYKGEEIETLRRGLLNEEIIKKAEAWLNYCLSRGRGFFAEGEEIIGHGKWLYSDIDNELKLLFTKNIKNLDRKKELYKNYKERISKGGERPFSLTPEEAELWDAAEEEVKREGRVAGIMAANPLYDKKDAEKKLEIIEDEHKRNIKSRNYSERLSISDAIRYGLISRDKVETQFAEYIKKESGHNIANQSFWQGIKTKFNYFWTNAQNNSIIGKISLGLYAAGAGLIKWSNVGEEYRKAYQENQNFLDYYNMGSEFSSVQRLALGVGSLGVDAGVFKALGGASSALGIKIIPGSSALAGYGRSAFATGNTLGLYNGISTFGDILGEKPISDFGWADIGKIGYESGKGYATGAAIGMFGEYMRVLKPKNLWGLELNGKFRWLGETAVEGGVIFPLAGAGWDYAWGDKEAFDKITFERIWHGIVTIGIMKASNGGETYSGKEGRSNSAGKDYYEVLGVKRNAGEAEIKTAYRNKAKELHPDNCIGCSEREIAARTAKTAELNEAKAFFDEFFKASKDYNIKTEVERGVEINPEGGYNAVNRVTFENDSRPMSTEEGPAGGVSTPYLEGQLLSLNGNTSVWQSLLPLHAVNQRFWPYPAIFRTNTGGSAWLMQHRGVPLFITAGHAAPKVGSTVLFNNDSGRTVKGLIVAAQSGGGHDYSIAYPLGDVSGIKPFGLSLKPADILQELNSFGFPGGIRYLSMPHKVMDGGEGWFKINNGYNAITKGSSGSVVTDKEDSGKAYGLISRFDNNGRDIMVYGREGIRAGLTDAVKRIIFDADLREDIISRFPAFGRNYANVLNSINPSDTPPGNDGVPVETGAGAVFRVYASAGAGSGTLYSMGPVSALVFYVYKKIIKPVLNKIQSARQSHAPAGGDTKPPSETNDIPANIPAESSAGNDVNNSGNWLLAKFKENNFDEDLFNALASRKRESESLISEYKNIKNGFLEDNNIKALDLSDPQVGEQFLKRLKESNFFNNSGIANEFSNYVHSAVSPKTNMSLSERLNDNFVLSSKDSFIVSGQELQSMPRGRGNLVNIFNDANKQTLYRGMQLAGDILLSRLNENMTTEGSRYYELWLSSDPMISMKFGSPTFGEGHNVLYVIDDMPASSVGNGLVGKSEPAGELGFVANKIPKENIKEQLIFLQTDRGSYWHRIEILDGGKYRLTPIIEKNIKPITRIDNIAGRKFNTGISDFDDIAKQYQYKVVNTPRNMSEKALNGYIDELTESAVKQTDEVVNNKLYNISDDNERLLGRYNRSPRVSTLSEKEFMEQSRDIERFYTNNIEWANNSLNEIDTQIKALDKLPFNTSAQKQKLSVMRKRIEEGLAKYKIESGDFNVRQNKGKEYLDLSYDDIK